MSMDIIEGDWKIFRQLHSIALERFCQKAIADIESKLAAGQSPVERFRGVFEVVERHDKDMTDLFDDMRRSTALLKIANLRYHGLVTDEEMSRFSPEMRTKVQGMLAQM